MESVRINKIQLLAGTLFLFAGTLEYLFNRPVGSAYFLSPINGAVLYLHNMVNPYGKLGFVAPDFFHPLAFALICMALLPNKLRYRIAICLAWFGIDAALELAQKYGTHLAVYLPQWFEKIPVIENFQNYLVHGTFDSHDVLAIGCGTLTALIIGQLTKGGHNNARKN